MSLPDDDETDRLAALLGESIPWYAVPFLAPGTTALAWSHNAGDLALPPEEVRHVDIAFVRDGLGTRCLTHHRLPLTWDDVMVAIDGGVHDGSTTHPCTLLGLERGNATDVGALADAIRELAAGADASLLLLMAATGLDKEDCLPWLAPYRPDATEVAAFTLAHPWLALAASMLPTEAGRGSIREACRSGPDAAAMALLVTLGASPAGARRLGDRMSGLVLDSGMSLRPDEERVAALLAVPPERFPSRASPAAGPPAMVDHLALYELAGLAGELATTTGRDVRSLLGGLGRHGRWEEALRSVARRCDLGDLDLLAPGNRAAHACDLVKRQLGEATFSFANEVLAPARLIRGDEGVTGIGPRLSAAATTLPAYRALVGDRTLGGVVDVVARWHREVDAITALVEGLRHGDGAVGPALFEPRALGDGLTLACLREPGDILAEGARGRDRNGAAGLDHCVGSYVGDVVAGISAIVSLRRVAPSGGYERLSTAEVDFSAMGPPRVVQHRGLRNATPSEAAGAALARGLLAIADEAREALAAFVPAPHAACGAAEAIVRAGAWERVRDAWSFALTRPRRAMGPVELLADLGA